MFDFEKPRIEIAEISEDNKYGRFVVEPLERGYGTTLGNSLRRIMLSSLPGAAVSAVKIKAPDTCRLSGNLSAVHTEPVLFLFLHFHQSYHTEGAFSLSGTFF